MQNQIMQITEMQHADLEKAAQLAEQLGYPLLFDEIRARFLEISNSSNHKLFVAKIPSHRIVGSVLENLC